MTDFERNIKYQTKLSRYNSEIKKNQERSNRINDLKQQNNQLNDKVERLKSSKNNINNQIDPINTCVSKLNITPNYDDFKGTKETAYWYEKKQPLINQVNQFKNITTKAINQINQKIRELEQIIDSNMHSINKLNSLMTNPVKPTY